MAMISTQTNETAEGEVRAVYDQVLQRLPFIPKPVEMMSANPEFMPRYWSMISYILERPRLSTVSQKSSRETS